LKRFLQILALVLLAGTPLVWLATGAHRGWTKTSVAIEKTDAVTGLPYRDYENRFVMGVELLALGCGVGLAIGGASFLVKRSAA
jgi:hypothetical protein